MSECENCMQLVKTETGLIESILELEKEITELKAKLKSAHLANHSLQVKVNTLDEFSITTKTDQDIFLEFAETIDKEYAATEYVDLKSQVKLGAKISIELNSVRDVIARFSASGKLSGIWVDDNDDGLGER